MTRGRRIALHFLLGSATLLAIDIARRMYRHRQLFAPEREPAKSWDPADYGIDAGAVEERWIETPDGEMLHAWYARASSPVASALFCHGNTGNLTTVAEIIPHLLAAGVNALFFDYRGYGKSSGYPSLHGVVADGVTAARHHDRLRPKHLPSILYGFSLGGGIAAQVLERHPFDGVILQSTFTKIADVARTLYPRLPMHLFAGDIFDTVSVIRRLEVPLLVLHGSDDEVIPAWMAHALHDACPTTRRIEIVEGGLHKDIYVRNPDTLIWTINQFAITLPRNVRSSLAQRPPRKGLGDRVIRRIRRFVGHHSAGAAL